MNDCVVRNSTSQMPVPLRFCLLFILVLAGCGQQPAAPVGNNPAPAPAIDGPLSDEDAEGLFRNELARFVREVTEREGDARAQTIRNFIVDEETTKQVFGELGDEVWPICESSIETRVLVIGGAPELMTPPLLKAEIAFGALEEDSPDTLEILAAVPDGVRVFRSLTAEGEAPAIFDYVMVDGTVRGIPKMEVLGEEVVDGRVERAWERFLEDAVSDDDNVVRQAMADFMVDESTLSLMLGDRGDVIWPEVESQRDNALSDVAASRDELRENLALHTSFAVNELDRSERSERVLRMRIQVLHALVPDNVRIFSVWSILPPTMFATGDDFSLHCVLIDGVVHHIPPVNELVDMLDEAGVLGGDYSYGVDWARAEDAWFDTMQRGLAELPEEYSEEVFYGAFFDCNSYYMGMQLYLNTEAALRETAERYQRDDADLYPGWTVEELMKELRWSGGEWTRFQPLFLDSGPEVEAMYAQLTSAYKAAYAKDEWEDLEERYMEMCCRVVIRLDDVGAFDGLQRTPDFRAVCVEEEEAVEDGEERLERVRASFRSDEADEVVSPTTRQ